MESSVKHLAGSYHNYKAALARYTLGGIPRGFKLGYRFLDRFLSKFDASVLLYSEQLEGSI